MMIRDDITKAVEQAVIRAQDEGLIPKVVVPAVQLEHPQNPGHGDYATSIALKLGRVAKAKPLALAETIVRFMPSVDGVEGVGVAAPGFMNFVLSEGWLRRQVDIIVAEAERYGDSAAGRGSSVQVEFVSVNPTGPLHVGHGRGAVLGSTLANLLCAAGFDVVREYYLNDAGNQMQNFYASLHARYCQALGSSAEVPSEGYHGQYVVELAEEIVSEVGDRFMRQAPEEAVAELGRVGMEKVMAAIRDDLALLGVGFDVWFSEQQLYDSDQFARVMGILRRDGYVEDREGAVWFVSTGLGEDKDNVLIRSSGVPTYFAADIAYHHNKFLERGFGRVIDIWGADHQGHVSRMKAAIGALGVAPERLQIMIAQMVSLRRGKEQVRASKRAGDIITLREVIDEVGADVCRFFFLARSADSQMDFDLELAKKESMDNPVYYVQYGYARIAGILRLARNSQLVWDAGDVSTLTAAAEVALIRKLLLFPEIVEMAALNLEPHHLPHFALDLATAFHNFYETCRVITDDRRLTEGRLKLVEATGIVLGKTLRLMGMRAPDRM